MTEEQTSKPFNPTLVKKLDPIISTNGKVQLVLSLQQVDNESADTSSQHLVVERIKLGRTGMPFGRPTNLWIPADLKESLIKGIQELTE